MALLLQHVFACTCFEATPCGALSQGLNLLTFKYVCSTVFRHQYDGIRSAPEPTYNVLHTQTKCLEEGNKIIFVSGREGVTN